MRKKAKQRPRQPNPRVSVAFSAVSDIEPYVQIQRGIPRTDWSSVSKNIGRIKTESAQSEARCRFALLWLQKMKEALGPKYRIHESDNFRLLTDESDRYVGSLLKFLERALKRIRLEFRGILRDEKGSKRIAIIYSDLDQYHSYVGNYYPEKGEFGLSGGMYINQGFGYFVFPHNQLSRAEPVAAHELTHACLSHLAIPLWLNEGIAVAMEDIISGSYPLRMDSEMFTRHKNFWGKNEIQEFWSGQSFSRSDEGQELSYHLARFAVQALSHDYSLFKKFVLSAHNKDGGEAAALKVFGGSLGGLIEQMLGPGDWKPKPARGWGRRQLLLRSTRGILSKRVSVA